MILSPSLAHLQYRLFPYRLFLTLGLSSNLNLANCCNVSSHLMQFIKDSATLLMQYLPLSTLILCDLRDGLFIDPPYLLINLFENKLCTKISKIFSLFITTQYFEELNRKIENRLAR